MPCKASTAMGVIPAPPPKRRAGAPFGAVLPSVCPTLQLGARRESRESSPSQSQAVENSPGCKASGRTIHLPLSWLQAGEQEQAPPASSSPSLEAGRRGGDPGKDQGGGLAEVLMGTVPSTPRSTSLCPVGRPSAGRHFASPLPTRGRTRTPRSPALNRPYI